jgi:dipeptide/tripeptide permease
MVDLQRSEPPPLSLGQGPKPSWDRAFSASACLSVIRNFVFARSSVAVAIAGGVVLVVAVVVITLWTGIGDSDISPAGWITMGFGVIITLALGIGLMALVFISSRRGYDELGRDSSTAHPEESGE